MSASHTSVFLSSVALALGCTLPGAETTDSPTSETSGSIPTTSNGTPTGELPDTNTSTSDDTGDDSTSTTDDISTGDISTGDDSTSGETTTTPGEPPGVCGNGIVEHGEECDDGFKNSNKNNNACRTNCMLPWCGDGVYDYKHGEECDDGANEAIDDGCTPDCIRTHRYEHEGIALNVPIVDILNWEVCWQATHDIGHYPPSSLVDACPGDQIMFACRNTDDDFYHVVAHAPRDKVFLDGEVDWKNGLRTYANGVAWVWAPSQNMIGFEHVDAKITDQSMAVGMSNGFIGLGGQCGAKTEWTNGERPKWERVILHSFDVPWDD